MEEYTVLEADFLVRYLFHYVPSLRIILTVAMIITFQHVQNIFILLKMEYFLCLDFRCENVL